MGRETMIARDSDKKGEREEKRKKVFKKSFDYEQGKRQSKREKIGQLRENEYIESYAKKREE